MLLWQPAILVAELRPQQNIIAVLVDDSRSMAIADDGATREAQAVKALRRRRARRSCERNFRFASTASTARLSRIAKLDDLKTSPRAPATHIGDGLKQLAGETADLPIGAVVLLSDGADNSGGIDLDTISTFRSRRIPVHTVGFGLRTGAARRGNRRCHGRAAGAGRFAPGRQGQLSPARLCRAESHADGSRRRQSSGGRGRSRSPPTARRRTKRCCSTPAPPAPRRCSSRSIRCPGEENHANNSVTRLVNVESSKRRILYVEGEPRWEYKFIRRAEEDDRIVQLVSMLRTSENKIYRQGIDDPKELADGFPSTRRGSVRYQAIIIGSVEASYFTPAQQELIQQFVDRRGGGLLLLGGRALAGDGGWGASSLADLLPVVLPNRKDTFHRDPATVELTPAGADSIITRLVEDPAGNAERWKKLPYLMDYQEAGTPKPGAAVLAEMTAGEPEDAAAGHGELRPRAHRRAGHRRHLALADEPAARRSDARGILAAAAALAGDRHAGRVVASVPSQMLFDDGRVQFSADVRDKNYLPAADAHVEAHILGPDGTAAEIEMTPDPELAGHYPRRVDRRQARIVSRRSDRDSRQAMSWAATC